MSSQASNDPSTLRTAIDAVGILGNAGLLKPSFLLSTVRATRRWGVGSALGLAAASGRRRSDVAVFDDLGSITFGELYDRSQRIAVGLAAAGVGPGTGVGVLCRNHRGFIESLAAISMCGADTLLLNTGFAAPQLSDVLEREGMRVVIYDEEFEGIIAGGAGGRECIMAWHDAETSRPTLDQLVAKHDAVELPKPAKAGRATLLTSGTTGTPKGASRRADESTDAAGSLGLLEALPLRTDDIVMLSAPAFHAWGMAHTLFSSIFQSTVIFRRKFEPEQTLADIEKHEARSFIVVPVMLQRILNLPKDVLDRYDLSSLRMVASSGSALPGELALRWMDQFGDNLYNFYGSTEVSATTVAGPEDLRAAPGTAGRPPRGTILRLVDDAGELVPDGQTGRIFVHNGGLFQGYTGGGTKEMLDGFMSIGDVGRLDESGRLFVEGRDDDMIVSGGENVFPSEVEDLLNDHPAVAEAAVVGVVDDEFGQRLKAFVVLKEAGSHSESSFKEHVKENLARHKVPREVAFLDELPRNPAGKILKRMLQ
jgi:acyl-CoA synthetase (AMP-forming)/AMP-acid ligase II